MQEIATVGVVQWVIPARPKRINVKDQINRRYSPKQSGYTPADSFPSPDSDANSITSNHAVTPPDSIRIVLPDPSLLRTISAFAEGHLRELEEHQKAINKARSLGTATAASAARTQPADSDTVRSKIEVRDEQTKAIETIRQLTNYYKELTLLLKQCDAQRDKVDEETINKLSDLRSEIIHAINEFVLANDDIDLPISDLDDSDYDYCFGAREALHDRTNLQQQTHLANQCNVVDEQSMALDNSYSESINNQQLVTTIDDQSMALEKRRREVLKIERDTEELKRLFTDFFTLVKAQGEQVDSIENNIVIATNRINEGHRNVNKAMKSLTVIMPVTGCIAGALVGGPLGLALGGKLGGITVGCVTSLVGLVSSIGAQRCIVANRIKKD